MKKWSFSISLLLALTAIVFLAISCQFPGATGTTAPAVSSDLTGLLPDANSKGYMVSYGYCPNFPAYRQARGTWCWAAVVLMVCDYLVPGFDMYQSEIVSDMCGSVRDTPEGYSPGSSWPKYGVQHTFTWGTIDWDSVKYYINLHRPISADIQWKSSGGDHAMLIWGYAVVAYPEYRTTRYYLMIVDPADGKKKSVEYDYFVDNNSYYWRLTRYNIYYSGN